MANQYFGTAALSGLNIKTGSHLIGDHELRVSDNGWTDEDGVWSVAKRPERLYSGTAIVAFDAGRMSGADHLVWLDGSSLYDNGALIGTIADVGSDMDIIAVDDAFMIMGAAKNYIYDGTHIREQGSWQPDYINVFSQRYTVVSTGLITAITKANPCVVTVDYRVGRIGDFVYVDNGSNMLQINDGWYEITAATGTIGGAGTITLDLDSTDFTAWSAGGKVDERVNITGGYRWYVVPAITLSDGTVLKGRPRGLPLHDGAYDVQGEDPILTPSDGYDADVLTIAAGDGVNLGAGTFKVYFVYDGDNLFDISGTAGTDYTRSVLVYRTKQNGYDVYLERTRVEGDGLTTAFTDASGSGLSLLNMNVGKADKDLGAVLPYDFTEHTNPPQSDFATFAGQRAFVANGGALHWSMFDGLEYFSLSGNTLMWDTITGLGRYNDYCIVFSADRMWAVRIINGVPDIEEMNTSVGSIWPGAIAETSLGLAFLRDDGLWIQQGGEPQKISRMAFVDILSPTTVVQAGDLLYLSGSEEAYVMINRGDRWSWHKSDHFIPYAGATSGVLYGASATGVYKMFNGARSSGKFKTKDFGGFDLTNTTKLELDIEGDTVPKVWVNGNVLSDTAWHADETLYSFPGRRVVWCHLPRIQSNYVNFEVEVSGDCRVYGLRGKHER